MKSKKIKHSNIIYMPTISELGGIETYVYELVKKYKDLDIAVVSKSCDKKQRERINKYCKVYIHKGQEIECDVCIINYDQGIIPYISENAKIYQTIHMDYSDKVYEGRNKPRPHPRITGYIAITKYLQGKMKEILGVENVLLSYNPLTIEKEEDPIIIVTASRLHENKGKDVMQKFANAMDKSGKRYIWYVITNDIGGIDSPNVVFIKNRLDISKWTSKATYGALFSKTEACSYFINEMLYRNIPMLVTPLPYLKEIGVEDGKNAYIVDFDGGNIDEVVAKIDKVPKFTFNKMNDKYNELFTDKKSHYESDKDIMVWVECIRDYYDVECNEMKYRILPKYNKDGSSTSESQHKWECKQDRADELEELGLVCII